MPYLDYSHVLPRVDPLVPARRKALSGFNQNKTPDGPFVGAYGELIAEIYLNDMVKAGNLKSCRYTGGGLGPDFELVTTKNKTVSIDVKTKRRSVVPFAGAEMSVPAYLSESPGYVDPDLFLCISLRPYAREVGEFTQAWVVGFIAGNKFRKKCNRVKEGARVGGRNGVIGRMPCDVFNVKFRELTLPSNQMSLFRVDAGEV
ncbi:MAG: hypothetical protein WCO60_18710 [Verrucomicrobiota bacterium]